MFISDDHQREWPIVRPGWSSVLLVGGLILAAVLLINASPEQLSNDAIQYMVVAENLLDGNGVRTDIVYYDVQYGLGPVPIQQTVFPPGFPVVIAILIFVGFSATFAAAMASAIGLAILPAMLFAILVTCNVNRFNAGVAGLIQLTSVIGWQSVPFGLSEPIYTAITLASLYFVARFNNDKRVVWMVLAAIAAGLSVYFRHQGLFFAFGLGVGLVLWVAQRPAKARIYILGTYGITAGIVMLPLLARNLLLAGHIGGGAVRDIAFSGASRSLERLLWVATDLTGFSGSGLRSGQLAEVAFIVAGLGCMVVLLRRKSSSNLRSVSEKSTVKNPVFLGALGYVGSSVVILSYLALSNSDHILTSRYFSVLVPFVALLLVLVLDRMNIEIRPRSFSTAAVFAVAGLAVLAGQKDVFDYRWGLLQQRVDIHRSVSTSLNRKIQGGSIRDMLRQRLDAGQNVLAYQAQLTRWVIERPVFGVPNRLMSNNDLSVESLECLAAKTNIQIIVTYPGLFDSTKAANANRLIFDNPRGRELPPWISIEFADSDIVLLQLAPREEQCEEEEDRDYHDL